MTPPFLTTNYAWIASTALVSWSASAHSSANRVPVSLRRATLAQFA